MRLGTIHCSHAFAELRPILRRIRGLRADPTISIVPLRANSRQGEQGWVGAEDAARANNVALYDPEGHGHASTSSHIHSENFQRIVGKSLQIRVKSGSCRDRRTKRKFFLSST
jgi:hypothetical protein